MSTHSYTPKPLGFSLDPVLVMARSWVRHSIPRPVPGTSSPISSMLTRSLHSSNTQFSLKHFSQPPDQRATADLLLVTTGLVRGGGEPGQDKCLQVTCCYPAQLFKAQVTLTGSDWVSDWSLLSCEVNNGPDGLGKLPSARPTRSCK